MKWYVGFFFALMCVSLVSAVDLQPGENVTFNYTNANNASVSELFACIEPAIEVLTASVNPGQINVTFAGDRCEAVVSCPAQDESTSEVCVVDARISPGEDYILQNDACDVRVESRNETFSCGEVDTYTVTRDVVVERDGETIFVRANGRTEDYFANSTRWLHSSSFDFECPVNVTAEDFASPEEALALYRELVPITIDHVNRTLSACADKAVGFDARVDGYFDAYVNESAKVQALIRDNENLEQQLKDANAAEDRAKDAQNQCLSSRTGWQVSAWFGWICAIIMGAALSVFILREVRA